MTDKMTFKTKELKDESVEQIYSVLIVDDDESLIKTTEKLLSKFTFKNRKINLLAARSGKEAFEVMQKRSDIALAIVDVVMESKDSGLELVRKVRTELQNKTTRIILRTGHPADFPPLDVVINYDLNDYLSKSDTDRDKLYISVTLALRTYDELKGIEDQKKKLENYEREIRDQFTGLRSFILRAISYNKHEKEPLINCKVDANGVVLSFDRAMNAPHINNSYLLKEGIDVAILNKNLTTLNNASIGAGKHALEVIDILKSGQYDSLENKVRILKGYVESSGLAVDHYLKMLPVDLAEKIENLWNQVPDDYMLRMIRYETDAIILSSNNDSELEKAVKRYAQLCKQAGVDPLVQVGHFEEGLAHKVKSILTKM